MSENNAQSGGVGFFGLLGLLFIGLKLGGIIDWSWCLVLLPLYGPLALILLIMCLFAILGTVCLFAAAFLDEIQKRTRRKK